MKKKKESMFDVLLKDITCNGVIKTIDESLCHIDQRGGAYVKILHPILKKEIFIENSDLYILYSIIIFMKKYVYKEEDTEFNSQLYNLILLLYKIDSYNNIKHTYQCVNKEGHFCIL